MTYAEGIEEFVDRCNAAMPPDFYKWPVNKQRKMYHNLKNVFSYDVPDTVSASDEIAEIGGRKIPFRLYRPRHRRGDGVLIYIRGGGFVVGSLETHHTVVAELCDNSGLLTIAPDFRMAPENPFPAALEDCYGVLEHLAAVASQYGADPDKIVISGDSSGANMAVVVCMMSRDRHGPRIRGQALISPVLDFTRWQQGGQDAPLLTGGEMEYYTACYAPQPGQVSDPYVSPLVSGSFEDLPPAYIMGAEMDSLLVDSETYADRLRQHGNEVELVIEPGLVHSAVRARGLCPKVAEAWKRFCEKAGALADEKDTVSA